MKLWILYFEVITKLNYLLGHLYTFQSYFKVKVEYILGVAKFQIFLEMSDIRDIFLPFFFWGGVGGGVSSRCWVQAYESTPPGFRPAYKQNGPRSGCSPSV